MSDAPNPEYVCVPYGITGYCSFETFVAFLKERLEIDGHADVSIGKFEFDGPKVMYHYRATEPQSKE